MESEPQHCFACDRRLDAPQNDTRGIPRCRSCRADHATYVDALGYLRAAALPQFRGVVVLGVPLPGWPTDITLVALAVWDRFSELGLVEVPGPNPPPPHPRAISGPRGYQPPHKWTITTDDGTVHHGGPCSGGTPGTDRLLAWHSTIAPSLPADAQRIDVHAQAPGTSSRTTIDLTARPLTRRQAGVEQQHPSTVTDPDCPSCGPPPRPAPPTATAPPPALALDWTMPAPPEPSPNACREPDPRPLCATCRSTRDDVCATKVPQRPHPDRVVALGANLGGLFGAQLAIPALVVWSTWFDITIVGHHTGAWADVIGTTNRAGRWSAHDDRGNRYAGTSIGGGTGIGLAHTDLTFIPALAPDATTLTVEFPPSFDGQVHHATVDLTPSPPP